MGLQYPNRSAGCQPRMRKWVDGCLDGALDLLLPTRCLLCGGRAGADALCAGCFAGLPWMGTACPRCALPVAVPGDCGECLQRAPPWEHAAAAMAWRFPADVLVGLLKFHGQLAAAPALAAAMVTRPPATDLDCAQLLPVPLHWSRLVARGHNQALELAVQLSRRTGLPLLEGRLRRRRRTPAQSGLDAATRRRNLAGAFAWRGPPPRDTHLVLVDDVMTTASTALECTRVLLAAGAARVDLWVAARAVKD